MNRVIVLRSLLFASCCVSVCTAVPAEETSSQQPVIWQTDFAKGVFGWVNERPDVTGVRADNAPLPSLRAELFKPCSTTRFIYYGQATALVDADPFTVERAVVLRGTFRATPTPGLLIELRLLGIKKDTRMWISAKLGDGSVNLIPPTTEWQTVERRFVIPAGVQAFHPYLCLNGETGSVWLSRLEARLDNTREHRIAGAENNIFFAEQGQMRIQIADADDHPEGTISLFDEQSRLLRAEKIANPAETILVDLPGRGFYRLVVNCHYPGGKVVEATASAAVTGTPLPREKRIGSRYGLMDVHGSTTQAARLGAYWNWDFFNYKGCKQGADGEPVELPAKSAKKTNPERQTILAGLMETPLWLNPDQPLKGLYPPKDWAKFEKMVTFWAKAQTDLPKIVTPYNEPDAHWHGSIEDLVRYHKTVTRAIRAGRPGTQVMGPCLYGIRMEYLKKLVTLGVLDGLDGIVIHAYVNGTPPEAEFIDRVSELKGYLKSIGKENFPLYLTEFGWTTRAGTWQKPVDDLTQARYLTRSLALLSSVKVNGLVYFCYQYFCDNAGEQGFSLLNERNQPKPSLCAFATLTRWLAGVRGETRWLRLSPHTHLILGDDEGSTVAVVWSTAEEGEKLPFPVAPVASEDFLGRPVAVTEGTLNVSPSPLFLQLKDASLTNLQILAARSVSRGEQVALPTPAQVIPAPLKQENGRLSVPIFAAVGEYLVLGRNEKGAWIGQPIRVVMPFAMDRIVPNWPLGGDPTIAVAITPHLKTTITGTLTLADTKNAPLNQQKVFLKNGEPATVVVPVPSRISAKGTLRLIAGAEHSATADTMSVPVDLRFLGASAAGETPLPPCDSADWDRFGTFHARPADAPADCAADLRAEYGTNGLRVIVRVTDDVHQQTASPEKAWTEDSIQIAFDADVQKEWQPNNMGFGFNGHRIFEYTTALTQRGPEVWRGIAYDPVLQPAMAEPRVVARIAREGVVTTYDLLFPWATIGLNEPLQRGSTLGFSLAVNDEDGKGRHGLTLFGGIVDNKDPQNFGRLWLR